VLFVLGRYGEAIIAFERVVQVVGGNAQDFYVLARLYSLQGDNGRARQAYAEVVRLAPQSAEAAKAREILGSP
jgi:cytochrome c-type biogenesis protein CcmH/NrfG